MAAGLTYSPSSLELGLQIARGPESLTQASGLGNLGQTTADVVGLATQQTLERMKTTAEEALGQLRQPKAAPSGYSGIAFSPSTNKLFVGGMTFDREDVSSAVQAQSLVGQPPQPAPANVATDWEPVSPEAYNQYIQNLKTPRGFVANVVLGARDLAESRIGGVGNILTAAGAGKIGRPISAFATETFGQAPQEQARSALIQQSNSMASNIWDAVAQSIPSVGLSLLGGGLGAMLGGARALRAGALAAEVGKARTTGALAGLAASTYPSEFHSFYEAASKAKNPDGTPAYDINDPTVRSDIAIAAAGTTLFQTLAEGYIAAGFSPFFAAAVKKAGEDVARTAIGRAATGAAKGAASEGFAEGLTQLAQQAAFDPEFRSKLNASDWKALAPYVVEKYGENALIAAGAGAVLGGGFGAVLGAKPQIGTGKPVDILKTAPATAEPTSLALPAPPLQLEYKPAGLPEVVEAPPPAPTLALPAPATPTPTPPSTEGLPLFGFPQGVLQTPVGETIPLPPEGGAGVAPAPTTVPFNPAQLSLPLEAPQPELPLTGGRANLRRGNQIAKQLLTQQTQSLAAQAQTLSTYQRKLETARPQLLPVATLEFAETPTAVDLKSLRAFMAQEQRERQATLALTKQGRTKLDKLAQTAGVTTAEARRIVTTHRNAAERALKQLDGYIADPTKVPLVQAAPAPAPAPVVSPPAAPAPTSEVTNAAQVGQVQQGGQPQYTGTSGQVSGVGQNRNIPAQIQEGGGQTGGGNLLVEGGAQPQEITGSTVNIGDKLGKTTFITRMDPRAANLFDALWRATGLKNTKVFFAIADNKAAEDLFVAQTSISADNRAGLYELLRRFRRSTSKGQNTMLPDGSAVVFMRSEVFNRGSEDFVETVSHEIGHAVHRHALTSATGAEYNAIMADYEKHLRRVSGFPDSDIKKIMGVTRKLGRAGADPTMWAASKGVLKTLFDDAIARARAQGKEPSFVGAVSALHPRGAVQELLQQGISSEIGVSASMGGASYYLGFNEWFADNVAKWATTQQKPLTLVEKFFKKLADRLRKFVELGQAEGFLPAQSVVQFLERMGTPDALGVEDEPTPPTGGGAAIEEMVQEPVMSELGTTAETPEQARTVSDTIRQNVNSLPPAARDSVTTLATNMRDWSLKGLYGMSFGSDLANMIRPLLPSVVQYFDLMNARSALANQLRNDVDRIMQQATGIGSATMGPLNKFLADSTIQQKWGYQPTWRVDREGNQETVEIDPELAAQWAALPREAQVLADKIFEHGFNTMRRMRQVMIEKIQGTLTGEEWNALSPEDRQLRQQAVRDQLRTLDTMFKERTGPYAPLSRFGNYVTVGKSAEYQAIDSIPKDQRTAEQKAQLQELRADPEHYVVIFSDSLGAAEAKARRIAEDFPGMTTDFFERQKLMGKLDVPVWMQLQKINAIVETDLREELGNAAVERLNSMLMDLYIGALADSSSRRHQLAREGVAGYSEMLRAFAVKGTADAHFIASMSNDSKVSAALELMRREASQEGGQFARSDRLRAFNEIMARHINGMTKEPTPLQDKLLRFNSIWTLMTLPRYYILNGTQTFMLSLPYMAARFGYNTSLSAVNNTYRELYVSFGKDPATLKKFLLGDFDLKQLKKADGRPYSDGEIAVLESLRDKGLLDVGLGYDLDYWENYTTPVDDGTMGQLPRVFSKAIHAVTALSRQVEVVNRISAGMAAYRLAEANPTAVRGMTSLDYAVDVLNNTQGDYSSLNAPRFFSSFAFSKVVFQFRKFQLMQAALLVKNVHDAFRGATPEERKVARAVLKFVLGQTAVVTGALGLPLATSISYLLAAAFGPPDEPVDEERFLRSILGDSRLVDVLLRGVPAGLGVDVSGQLGLNNTFSIVPYADVDVTSREGLGKTLLGIGGPLLGTAANFADGFGLMAQGDYYKGLEFLMPNGVKTAMRAYRETFDKGVTRRNGDLVVSPEEFTFLDTMLQSLGFSATQLAKVKRTRQWQYDYDKYFSERTTQIRRDFVEARRGGDSAGEAAAKTEWQNLQLAKKRVGFKPSPLFNLLSSPKRQSRRERSFREQFTGLREVGGLALTSPQQ